MRSLELSVLLAFLAAPLTAQAPQPPMGAPLNGLTATQLQRFDDGKVDFSTVLSVSNGLGPIFNQTNCASCHNNPVGGPGSITVTRFGLDNGKGGFDPLTGLGGTLLQQGAIAPGASEVVPAVANVTSLRITPSALGAGLVEAIPDAAIAANETNQQSSGVSGVVHWVQTLEDPTGPARAGRFGWKSQIATVLSFSGDAAQNELGLTNRLLPTENAPNGNLAVLQQFDTVADPEDGPDMNGLHFIDRITDFQRYLAAPPQTPKSGMTGESIFNSVGCAECHVASYTTSNDPALEPAIRNQVIRPYSDFLLHDMGLAADFIADGAAGVSELRTPSLWGVRNRDPLWHDGRVAGGTLETRILSVGGIIDLHNAFGSESQSSAQAFLALSSADQLAVVAFLDSLGRREFDSNGDNMLDRTDLDAFVAAMGGTYTADDPEAVFDFDQNGSVDNVDLDAFALVYEEDCNSNGTNDLMDVLNGTIGDANENYVPDDCEFCQTDLGFAGGGTLTLSVCGDDLTDLASRATFQISQGPPNAMVLIGIGIAQNPIAIVPGEFLVPMEPLAAVIDIFSTDAQGDLRVTLFGGSSAPVMNWIFQAATFNGTSFDLSNALSVDVGGF